MVHPYPEAFGPSFWANKNGSWPFSFGCQVPGSQVLSDGLYVGGSFEGAQADVFSQNLMDFPVDLMDFVCFKKKKKTWFYMILLYCYHNFRTTFHFFLFCNNGLTKRTIMLTKQLAFGWVTRPGWKKVKVPLCESASSWTTLNGGKAWKIWKLTENLV